MANIWHFACFVAWSLQWEAGIWILSKGFLLQSGSDGLSLVPQKVSRKAASTRKAYVTSSRNIDKLQGQHMSNEEKKRHYVPLNPGCFIIVSLFHGLWNNPHITLGSFSSPTNPLTNKTGPFFHWPIFRLAPLHGTWNWRPSASVASRSK